jgi:PelA/Pel-15E family pectate lyase
MRLIPLITLGLLFTCNVAPAAIDLSKQVNQPDSWFASDEGKQILDNIVSWQNANGGWWKSIDATKPRPADVSKDGNGNTKAGGSKEGDWQSTSTFDNKSTYTELRLLARGYRIHQDAKYRDAFDRGLKFIFDAQYPNGGWPQRFPLEDNYGRHITFNDNAMVGVMNLLFDVAQGQGDFAWTSAEQRKSAKDAFDRGVKCILDTQIKAGGELTGWCQQHDAKTLAPTSARTYELPAIAGGETAEIARLLMRIENPEPRVKEAIRAAVAWFEASKMLGKRIEDRRDPSLPKGRDQVLVDDPSGEPLWARFYDIETNRPFYCGRDGVKKWSLDEIEAERRAGYAWVRPFGKQLLKEYPAWAARHNAT